MAEEMLRRYAADPQVEHVPELIRDIEAHKKVTATLLDSNVYLSHELEKMRTLARAHGLRY